MRLFIFMFLAFVLHFQNVVAQDFTVEKSDSTAKIEGELYVIHPVQPRQTLFSIAKTYGVKLSRITFDNPGVLDGLKLDQRLRILKSAIEETKPVEVTEETLELDGDYVLYTVPKQQTLYAISKEYNTTISIILDANPELADGLKVGSTIRIPTPKIFGDKIIIGDKKEVKLEMIGLPDIIRNRPNLMVLDLPERLVTNISLLLPLYLDLNDSTEVRRLSEQPEELYRKSEIALQFYEGFLLALDTLKQLGYNVTLKVTDTENRPWKVRNLVQEGVLKDADLIIGPFYSKVFSEVVGYSYQNCIPLVSPTIKGSDIIKSNPHVFKMIPSDESMIFGMGQYLSQSDSTTNMILHYGAGDEQNLLWQFRQGLESTNKSSVKFPAYDIYKFGIDSIRNRLSLTRRNNLVILSNNQVKLAGLIRKISMWAEDAYIVGFAPNSWRGFKNLEIDHFDELRIHMPAAFYIDYEKLEVEDFVQKFRAKFNGEPSSFAFRGYDVAIHFIKNLESIKSDGPEFMESVQETGFQSGFGWKRLTDGGFENTQVRMVDYTGLKLKLATD
jgi:LysM repeat protein/ABC-type branched-subunit amino acid transport system substrate-binding protein